MIKNGDITAFIMPPTAQIGRYLTFYRPMATSEYFLWSTIKIGKFSVKPIEYAARFDGTAFIVLSSDEFPHLTSEKEETIELKFKTRAEFGV